MRMQQVMTESHLVLSYRPKHTLRVLQTMVKREQWVREEEGGEGREERSVQKVEENGGGIVSYTPQQLKEQQLELTL